MARQTHHFIDCRKWATKWPGGTWYHTQWERSGTKFSLLWDLSAKFLTDVGAWIKRVGQMKSNCISMCKTEKFLLWWPSPNEEPLVQSVWASLQVINKDFLISCWISLVEGDLESNQKKIWPKIWLLPTASHFGHRDGFPTSECLPDSSVRLLAAPFDSATLRTSTWKEYKNPYIT